VVNENDGVNRRPRDICLRQHTLQPACLQVRQRDAVEELRPAKSKDGRVDGSLAISRHHYW
jgi:hypothetical protein